MNTLRRHPKETLFTKPRNAVQPMMLVDYRKATLQETHTDAINTVVNSQEGYTVLDDRPPSNNKSENDIRQMDPRPIKFGIFWLLQEHNQEG